MHLDHLACSVCGAKHDANIPQNLCLWCAAPLLAEYDFDAASKTFKPDLIKNRINSMWRYCELLPLRHPHDAVSLGEGMTPLLPLSRLAAQNGCRSLLIKDESQNPTQSFKARGMSSAVSMARQFGLTSLALPSAGNAASALAAYAARAGLKAYVFVPDDASAANLIACRQLGAEVVTVSGLISDCAAEMAKRIELGGWFDLSTSKEPYRIEGKKSMGFELAEQLNWTVPDVIIYPTGGGSGLIGMWKAFNELEKIGLLGKKRPRMFSIQAVGCAPIVHAFATGEKYSRGEYDGHNRSSGLRVPKAISDCLILEILRKSSGGVAAVTEQEIMNAISEVGRMEGIFAAPEGAAAYAGLKQLIKSGQIDPTESIVLFNTGSGIKYLEWFD